MGIKKGYIRNRTLKWSILVVFCFFVVLFFFSGDANDSSKKLVLPATVDFNFHIKPILSDRCFKCHGPDEQARKGNLRLDTEEGTFALLDSIQKTYAIVSGNLNKSLLSHRVSSSDPEFMMPPPESNLELSDYEIALLNKWIEQGAKWKKHWSFIPPLSSGLPKIQKKSWPYNEMDFYILARMEQEHLQPEAPATKEKWLRRVSFDITGLPPTHQELDDFLNDTSEDAFERVVDRLLDDPAYGERMASSWLDVARYADSHGYQDDRPRTMWPWRDWVIEAFNSNLPYDQFIKWQLAGDLIPNSNYEQKLATGFNRNHAITQEGGVVNEEYVTEYVADRTNTASTAFLGLTMECARCHDHKYDPISQKDYYSMFAFFNNIEERGQINYFDEAPVPNLKVEDAKLESLIAFIKNEITSLEAQSEQLKNIRSTDFQIWLNSHFENSDPTELLSQNLESYHLLNDLNDLKTVDEMNPERPGKVNTGLLEVLNPPLVKEGHKGKALQFDGTNFLNLGDIGDFDWYHPFSVGSWILPPSILKKDAALIVKRNGEQKRGGYELALTKEGFLRFSLIHDQQKERIEVRTSRRIIRQQWSHVFATYDGSGNARGVKLYINGDAQRLTILEDGLHQKSILNGNDLLAGNWTTRMKIREDIHGFTNGRLDEIRIYQCELSPLDVFTISERSFNPVYHLMGQEAKIKAQREILLPHYLLHYSDSYIKIRNQFLAQRRNVQPVPSVMIMKEMDTVRASYILARGAYDAQRQRVYPAPPSSVFTFLDSILPNRLGLARWMTDARNPLTSRVMVNRLWQMMFGRGLVATPEDFGNQGALPSHPALLDWLALDFVASGWNVKSMIRKMALSATYRQSSNISAPKLKADPGNILLSRGPGQRLTAEMIRDQALAVSGLLVDSIGGKWVKPYQPKGIWKELANQIGENKYRQGHGDELYRRSLYSYWKRTIPPPTMLTFDASERAVCTVKRQATTTPLQSLILLNDPQYIEASRLLAVRMMDATEVSIREGLEFGFRTVTSRYPTIKELEVLQSLFEAEKKSFSRNVEAGNALIRIGQSRVQEGKDTIELAAWTVVANALLNLDEAKMRS